MYLLPLFFYVASTGTAVISAFTLTDYRVCDTDACHEIGQAIQRAINDSSDPCDNFYNHACGLWPTNNPIPPTKSIWSMIQVHILRTNLRAKEVLEEQSEYDDLPPIRKVKQYYRSCMDEGAIEKEGLRPIMELLDSNGGWPIIMDTNLVNFTWQKIDSTYDQMFGGSSFFQISYEPIREDSSGKSLSLNIDEISLMIDNLDDMDKSSSNTNVDKITKIIKAVARYKGVELNATIMNREIREIRRFENKFLEVVLRSKREMLKGYDIKQTKMTISELQEYYDLAKTQNATAKINWLERIQFMYANVNVSIDASEPIMVYSKEFLHELAYLLDITSPRIIVNFIQWNIVNKFLRFLNKEMRDIDLESTQKGNNVTDQTPRWNKCIPNLPLQEALIYLYIKKYNFTDNIETVTEMIEEIKIEIKERIVRMKWMDNNTKEFLTDKLDNLVLQIGYPDEYDNHATLIEEYKGLLVERNYFKNVLSVLIHKYQRNLMKFRKPVDKYEWYYSPLIHNTFYSPQSNAIVVPLAQFEYPFLTPGMPLAVNYGWIGMMIGHELTHSFDATGLHFDKLGNIYLNHSEETSKAFDEEVKCFVDQYSNFSLIQTDENKEPKQIDGFLSRNENIADNVGLEVAFAAFQKRLLTAGPQPKLPGLMNITDEQLFFLSYANIWCVSTTSPEEFFNNNDVHPHPKIRTVGSTSNMVSFSNAFNCPVNSPMNREPKCSLWK